MTRTRPCGFTALLYFGLIIASLGIVGCSDSTDAPIAQPDVINPNLAGTFHGTGNVSLDGHVTAATLTLNLSFPAAEHDDLVEAVRRRAQPLERGRVRRVTRRRDRDGAVRGELRAELVDGPCAVRIGEHGPAVPLGAGD